MQYRLRTLLVIPAVLCFAAAYRFASHGIPAKDGVCISLAGVTVALGVGLLAGAFLTRPRRSTESK